MDLPDQTQHTDTHPGSRTVERTITTASQTQSPAEKQWNYHEWSQGERSHKSGDGAERTTNLVTFTSGSATSRRVLRSFIICFLYIEKSHKKTKDFLK